MLTKEELKQYRLDCVLALTRLSYNGKGHYLHALSSDIKLLEQLIEEHFKLIKCDLDCKNCWKFKFVERCYNLPLNFEELKEGMWYWDNKKKRYFKIFALDVPNKVIISFDYWGLGFEEGRFYRKQVEECKM